MRLSPPTTQQTPELGSARLVTMQESKDPCPTGLQLKLLLGYNIWLHGLKGWS